MRVDVSEGISPDEWAPLPGHDRVLVGGHTVWTGPFDPPVVVAQPNRWGVVERDFPAEMCLVEADPPVTAHLPLPARISGFLDRSHRQIDVPGQEAIGRGLMDQAARLAKSLTQTRGVQVAATPFARTVPLLTPRTPTELISECAEQGLMGVRALSGLAGGVALSVRPEHGPDHLDHVVAVIRAAVGR